LQENNAIAEINLQSGKVTSVKSLGYKDHSLVGNGLDPSDRDDGINIANWPVFGMYQPDGIAAYSVNDSGTYLVTANEGDARDYDGFSEEIRVKDLAPREDEDPAGILSVDLLEQFPNIQDDEELGRLRITSEPPFGKEGDVLNELYSYGARSFSIWTLGGQLIYDSGDDFEQITAVALPDDFNSTNDENDSFDNRSDDKGPEPEDLVVGKIGDQTYAFIGLERIGGIMIYDISDPFNPVFQDYVNNRDFGGDPELGTAGDLAPEGLVFIPADQSPSNQPLLAVANEVSGTTTIFTITELTTPTPLSLAVAAVASARTKLPSGDVSANANGSSDSSVTSSGIVDTASLDHRHVSDQHPFSASVTTDGSNASSVTIDQALKDGLDEDLLNPELDEILATLS
jgi:hypothetical protein